jgi:endonuclease G
MNGEFLFKSGIFAGIAGLLFWLFQLFGSSDKSTGKPESVIQSSDIARVPDNILPESNGEIIHHHWFSLAYNEDHEQAEWVVYELNIERLNSNRAERPNTFRPDPDASTGSATPRDYAGSGYDKGHLCPAADMAFDDQAIDETFLMSNISPQTRAFNMGIWRQLEEKTRDWARKFRKIYVVTGPVLSEGRKQIGENKVTVPAAFYKIILAPDQSQVIAFVLPNEQGAGDLQDYACSVDQAEEYTGIDFFPDLLNGPKEKLESALEIQKWPF